MVSRIGGRQKAKTSRDGGLTCCVVGFSHWVAAGPQERLLPRYLPHVHISKIPKVPKVILSVPWIKPRLNGSIRIPIFYLYRIMLPRAVSPGSLAASSCEWKANSPCPVLAPLRALHNGAGAGMEWNGGAA